MLIDVCRKHLNASILQVTGFRSGQGIYDYFNHLNTMVTIRTTRFNILKTKRNLIHMSQSYRAVNTFHHGYKNQSVNDV